MDVDDIGMSARLAFATDVGEMLNDLRTNGASVYSAIRDHQLRNDSWKDQSSWPVKVGFLAVVPADRHLELFTSPNGPVSLSASLALAAVIILEEEVRTWNRSRPTKVHP